MTALRSERVPGDGVTLRPLRTDDAEEVARACDDAGTRQFLTELPSPYTVAHAHEWIERSNADGAEVTTFAIADPGADRVVGSIALGRLSFAGRAGSIGYWVAPWARRGGVASAAARTLTAWAHGRGVQRLELLTDPENEPSQRVALAAGFRHEGVRRGGGRGAGGTLSDRVVWARLADDPTGPTPRTLPDLPADGLTDGVVTLRRMVPDDAGPLYDLFMLPEVIRTSVRSAPTPESVAARVARVPYQWLSGSRADLAIIDAATGAFAGDIGLFLIDPTGQGMIGYSVAREWRGRGFASRAARLVSDWAFAEAGLVRVVAGTAPDNIGSQRTLERAGFTREGYEPVRLPGPDGTRVDNVGSQRVLERAGFRREGYQRSRLPGPSGTRVDDVLYAILPGDLSPTRTPRR